MVNRLPMITHNWQRDVDPPRIELDCHSVKKRNPKRMKTSVKTITKCGSEENIYLQNFHYFAFYHLKFFDII